MINHPVVDIITDLQWGSCAKRLFTEYYCNKFKPDVIVSNGLPNSGGYDSYGVKWSAIPIGYPCKIMISPGSAIDINQFNKEVKQLPPGTEVYVHENAAVVLPMHIEDEKEFVRIGSTMTGGMRAVVHKMQRDPEECNIARDYADQIDAKVIDTQQWVIGLRTRDKILGLCAQGHGLSVNFGFYPYCTSRNTSPAQLIADSGIPMQWVNNIIGCVRTFPIRVANRYDDTGKMIGWSGPCYANQKEITWNEIGVPNEITSVSKKVRRVFTYSGMQLFEAAIITGCTHITLNFLNYIPVEEQRNFIKKVEHDSLTKVQWVGLGKTIEDIYSIEDYHYTRSWV